MTGLNKQWTRRQFMKAASFLALQPLLGCSTQVLPMEGKPPHHTATGFRNYPVMPPHGTPGFSFMFNRMKAFFSNPEIPSDHTISEPRAIADFQRSSGELSVTWIGHSTYLLKTGGRTLLLDPYLTDLASPLPVGPKRYVPPGISLKNLPPIDGIILSHNHYDHLDENAVENLPGKENIQVFVPLGMKLFFTERGYAQVSELDWHESIEMDGLKLTALPAVHFSSRWLNDRNETLWCSWAIQSSSASCYFAGDTGYSPTLFREIGNSFRSFDMAIVPIGAYNPQNVMKAVHTNPEEAIQLANDIRADIIVPSHWGTIELTDEPHWEPPERYRKFAVKNGISDSRAWIMKIGETRTA
ncbi:MAG: hydrolase [Deltaproteobacteria bacterium]|nr:hydrolase [Deltaproteobacteria bacterium]